MPFWLFCLAVFAVAFVVSSYVQVARYLRVEVREHPLSNDDAVNLPDARHQGVGRAMIRRLVDKLSQQRRMRLVCEVRERNLPAQKFFAACGFTAVGVLRDRYEEEGIEEDAYRFVYALPLDDFCSSPVGGDGEYASL